MIREGGGQRVAIPRRVAVNVTRRIDELSILPLSTELAGSRALSNSWMIDFEEYLLSRSSFLS